MRKHRWVAIMCIVALSAALMPQRVSARETLIPLTECPMTGPHRACLQIQFDVSDDDPPALTEAPNARDHTTTLFVALEGRLAGAHPAPFRLKLVRNIDLMDAQSQLGPFAYLGRSKRNRPVILTDRGALEISTAGIDAAFQEGLVIVDEKKRRIVGRYFELFGNQFIVTASHAISAWDNARGLCVSAPRKVPGLLTITTPACEAAGTPHESEEISGVVAPANDDADRSLAISRFAVPQLRYDGSADVYRIPTTTLVIVVPHFFRGT